MKAKRTSGRKKAGRPPTYRDTYPDMLIEHMRQGFSYETFAAVAGVGKSTLYNWEVNDRFLEAKKKGVMLSQKWWETLLRLGALGSDKIEINGRPQRIKPNPALIIFTMKCRFGWNENSVGDVSEEPYDEEL